MCQRSSENEKGVQACLVDAICPDGMKLETNSEDFACVQTCANKKYSEDVETKEFKCVDKCEHWWYKEQGDGFCKKEAWRKGVAIAVPVVIVVLVVAIVIAVMLVKKKKASRASAGKSKISLKQVRA